MGGERPNSGQTPAYFDRPQDPLLDDIDSVIARNDAVIASVREEVADDIAAGKLYWEAIEARRALETPGEHV